MPRSIEEIGYQQIGIANIFHQYWLKVPPNQREYAWEDDEVTELFQDLSEAINQGEESYFLGSIVVVPKSPQQLEVVDGQQRLATTAILLNSMREYLISIKEDMIAESIMRLLSDIDTDARNYVPRLTLNTDDNEFFQRSILTLSGGEPIDARLRSHELLARAKELANEHVQNILREHKVSVHGDVIKNWVDFLRFYTIIILLKSPSASNAYKMFETLNDRGIKTSQSDLIKNYLFGQAGSRLVEAQSKWSQMRGTLETLEEEEITLTFLRQAILSYYGPVRKERLFDTVETQIRGTQRSLSFLDSLESTSIDYIALLNPEADKWNLYPATTRKSVQTLNLILIRPMWPLMLAVARHFDPIEADKAYRAMISWCVRLLVTGSGRSGAIEQPFYSGAKDITDQKIKNVKDLFTEIENAIPNDIRFQQAFEIVTVSKASLARYFLRSIEMTAKHEPEPWFIPNDDKVAINLEHILPKKPDDNWTQFNRDELKAYCNKIGNQALLQASSNSFLRNSPFIEKKIVFGKSPYELTRQISNYADWTGKEILERQKLLAKLALKAWPLLP
ncbi:DUF262 domain-containing protein [Candidatus Acetothermia bacterium]|nr:DUF262 domain-containing protein [Candidatus Acetothermia bacterium]MBI3643505.1 DUF262 domain-containing protein [Candidatus Acetothermia bacterium]